MKKIVDLYGHYTNFDEMYEPENSWYGQVLVGADHQFEGFVRDYVTADCFYVCGTMSKENLDVYQCTSKEGGVPHRYVAARDKDRYYGTYYGTNGYAEIPVGECKMSIMPAEMTREETDYERELIQERIKYLKSELGESSISLLASFEQSKANQPTAGK